MPAVTATRGALAARTLRVSTGGPRRAAAIASRARSLAAAAALLVAGAGLQACSPSDAGAPAPATTPAATATTAAATATTAAAAPATAVAPAATAVAPAPATTAAPNPTPVANETSAGGGSSGIRVAPKDTGTEKSPAPSGSTGTAAGSETEPGRVHPDEEPTRPPPEADGDAGPSSGPSSGRVYTWQDGEHTRRVILQTDLSVRAEDEVTPQDRVVTRAGGFAVMEGSGAQPVFRSESGALMALPGGVLLALDPAWSEEQVGAFLERNAIPRSQVSDLGWLPNGYFIETAPGFPSLHLANALAGQDGVVLSAPNWWREVETR